MTDDELSDDELMEAWKRGELVVVEADDGTRTRFLAALDTIEKEE